MHTYVCIDNAKPMKLQNCHRLGCVTQNRKKKMFRTRLTTVEQLYQENSKKYTNTSTFNIDHYWSTIYKRSLLNIFLPFNMCDLTKLFVKYIFFHIVKYRDTLRKIRVSFIKLLYLYFQNQNRKGIYCASLHQILVQLNKLFQPSSLIENFNTFFD